MLTERKRRKEGTKVVWLPIPNANNVLVFLRTAALLEDVYMSCTYVYHV